MLKLLKTLRFFFLYQMFIYLTLKIENTNNLLYNNPYPHYLGLIVNKSDMPALFRAEQELLIPILAVEEPRVPRHCGRL